MRRLQGLGFAAFCLLSGSRWMVENAFPSSLTGPLQQGLHSGVISVVALAIWLVRGRGNGRAGLSRGWWKLPLAGSLMLTLPAVLTQFAGSVMEQDGAALFALVPLFVVVGVASYGANSSGRALMMPTLVGLAGALLLLPFQLPFTPYGAVMFAVVFSAVLVTAGVSVWSNALLRDQSISLSVAVFSGASFLVLIAAAFASGPVGLSVAALPGEILRCVAFDLPQMFVLLWLLREMSPVRLSARYLVVPMLTALEGVLFLHPVIDLRLTIGFLLMAGGGAALLFWRGDDADTSSSLGLG